MIISTSVTSNATATAHSHWPPIVFHEFLESYLLLNSNFDVSEPRRKQRCEESSRSVFRFLAGSLGKTDCFFPQLLWWFFSVLGAGSIRCSSCRSPLAAQTLISHVSPQRDQKDALQRTPHQVKDSYRHQDLDTGTPHHRTPHHHQEHCSSPTFGHQQLDSCSPVSKTFWLPVLPVG